MDHDKILPAIPSGTSTDVIDFAAALIAGISLDGMKNISLPKELLEVVSKPQIMFEGKARGSEKTVYTREYMSPPEAGRHFEPACNTAIGH